LNTLDWASILSLTSPSKTEILTSIRSLPLFGWAGGAEKMDNLNLVVKFMVAGDSRLQVKSASRIKVDGRGGLLLYDAQGGGVETIELGALKSFCLQQVPYACAGQALV
jgi:hypothetical protein